MLRDSSGPWILESIPQAPVIINFDFGEYSDNNPMNGIDPPVPTNKYFLSKIFYDDSSSF